jgi:hypothetical protein
MARSNIKTWLSLDRWAEIIGLNPLNFNQLASTSLFPNNVCGDVFFQYDWMYSDRIGRETIAMAIQAAEQEIAAEAGFNLMPDWTIQERLTYPQPGVPGMYGDALNPRWMFKSVELRKGHVISGGLKTKVLIESGAAVVRSDVDSDAFQETCTVTVATTLTDINEIRAFYPAKSGADGWEIRPITVAISGGNAVIQFKVWQIAAANQMDAMDSPVLDAHDAASYETTVDIYRVYNDPSTQVQFMWENCSDGNCCGSCVACQFGTQAGCFHLREARLGLAVPTPGSWDSTDQEFDFQEWSACREPEQVRFWYYSGLIDNNIDRPYANLAPYWEYAVAYYAASKIDRPVCGCSNVNQFIEKWRVDIAFSDNAGSYVTTPEMLANRLGTSVGGIYAWKRIHQPGVRIIK